MRILIITWEYPPKRLGEISDHVFKLSMELVSEGHDVEIITEDDLKTGVESNDVQVYRVPNPIKTHHRASVLSFVMTASIRMEQEAANAIYDNRGKGQKFDLIHAHEWLTIPPAITVKRAFNLPLILTLHSIEGHRCHDNFGPLNIAIKEIENAGIMESTRVIAKTDWMKKEILRYYGDENEKKIEVIEPGKDWTKKLVDSYNCVVDSEA